MFGKKAEAEAKMNEALREYYSFIKTAIEGKRDEQVDWWEISCECYLRERNLVEKFPEAEKLIGYDVSSLPQLQVSHCFWMDREVVTTNDRKNIWEKHRRGYKLSHDEVLYLTFSAFEKSWIEKKIKRLEQLLN